MAILKLLRVGAMAVALGGSGAVLGCGGGEIVVASDPPQPRVEVMVAAPYPGAVWIGGHWRWNGRQYVWNGGRWERPRVGYRWQPHAWVRRGPRWVWVEGGWRR